MMIPLRKWQLRSGGGGTTLAAQRWHGITMNWKCTGPLKCIYLHRMTFILTICFNYSMQIYILLALFPSAFLHCVAPFTCKWNDIYCCCGHLCTIYVWFRSNAFYWNCFIFASFLSSVRLFGWYFRFAFFSSLLLVFIAFQTWIHSKAICWRASCFVIVQRLKDLNQNGYEGKRAQGIKTSHRCEANEREKDRQLAIICLKSVNYSKMEAIDCRHTIPFWCKSGLSLI